MSRAEPAMRVVRRGPLSNSDYAALDKPRSSGNGLLATDCGRRRS